MKWVFVAILACIVPYTVLTLKYRKAAPAYQPYEDSKQRANVLRLLDAGYQRITVKAERPSDPEELVRTLNTQAEILTVAGGLPEDLNATLVETPLLPADFSRVPSGFRKQKSSGCLRPDPAGETRRPWRVREPRNQKVEARLGCRI